MDAGDGEATHGHVPGVNALQAGAALQVPHTHVLRGSGGCGSGQEWKVGVKGKIFGVPGQFIVYYIHINIHTHIHIHIHYRSSS